MSTLRFANVEDSLREWTCPLPVEATMHTMDKRKTDCVIIAADDSGFVVLSALEDPVLMRSPEWYALSAERSRQRAAIEADSSLSDEERQRMTVESMIGLFYRDTLRFPTSGIKKVVLHYSNATELRRTISLVAFTTAGCAFLLGSGELLLSNDPKSEGMAAPAPAILLVAGLGGLAATSGWLYHTHHKVIRPEDWQLRR